jgi:hypothetical protein
MQSGRDAKWLDNKQEPTLRRGRGTNVCRRDVLLRQESERVKQDRMPVIEAFSLNVDFESDPCLQPA